MSFMEALQWDLVSETLARDKGDITLRCLIVAAILAFSALWVEAAPPPNMETLEERIIRGCRIANLAFVGRVSNLRSELEKRDAKDPYYPRGGKQTADLTVIEMIKGAPDAVPRTLWGYKRIPMMSDQLGVDLEDHNTYLVIMDWPSAPGVEWLRLPELSYDGVLNKDTDTVFKNAVQVTRRACRQ